MSEDQYNELMRLRLSEPMPIEFEEIILYYLETETCPEWLRFGLRRFLAASQRMR